jgi:hypothetical protein
MNFENIEVLNVSGNFITEFAVFDLLVNLEFLVELDFDDPRFGNNPICTLANYDVVVIPMFPRLKILDTFKISTRFFSVCTDRKREVELYYATCAATDIAAVQRDIAFFQRGCLEAFASIQRRSALADGDLAAIAESFGANQHSLENFIMQSTEITVKTGGNIAFVRVDEAGEDWEWIQKTPMTKISVTGKAQLVAAWKIICRTVAAEASGSVIRSGSVDVDDLVQTVETIRRWPVAQDRIQSGLSIESDSRAVVVCDVFQNGVFLRRFVLHFEIAVDRGAQSLRGFVRLLRYETLVQFQTRLSWRVLNQYFSLQRHLHR